MTIRNTTFAAVAAAVLASPGLPAQDLSPDSLARLGLPADPSEFVNEVAAGEQSGWDVFAAGCPSGGGWAGAAFAAMMAAAETDAHVLRELAQKLGDELLRARELEHGRVNHYEVDAVGQRRPVPMKPQCPSELPGHEAWLAAQLRREWERGLLAGESTVGDGPGGVRGRPGHREGPGGVGAVAGGRGGQACVSLLRGGEREQSTGGFSEVGALH